MPLVDGLTSEQRERFDELVAEFGASSAETIRTVLEDACSMGGAEWSLVVADWTANMGRQSIEVIVALALRIRAGETIADEQLALIPSMWLQAAHTLEGLLSKADRDRAERTLAELPRVERRRRLNDGHRRNRAAMSAYSQVGIRADVVARLERARIRVGRRVERYARQLQAGGATPPIRGARRTTRRETRGCRRARAPDRSGADGKPRPSSHRLPRSEVGGVRP